MLIGDSVMYGRRRYTVVGFTPVSVTPAQVELLSLGGGERLWVDRQLVSEAPESEKAPLRLADRQSRRKTS